MKTATVVEIQRNFTKVLNSMKCGEEIVVTKRGKAIARITLIGEKTGIDWPDFKRESISLEGATLNGTVIENREERI